MSRTLFSQDKTYFVTRIVIASQNTRETWAATRSLHDYFYTLFEDRQTKISEDFYRSDRNETLEHENECALELLNQ